MGVERYCETSAFVGIDGYQTCLQISQNFLRSTMIIDSTVLTLIATEEGG